MVIVTTIYRVFSFIYRHLIVIGGSIVGWSAVSGVGTSSVYLSITIIIFYHLENVESEKKKSFVNL